MVGRGISWAEDGAAEALAERVRDGVRRRNENEVRGEVKEGSRQARSR